MTVHHAMKRNKLSAPTKFLIDWYNSNESNLTEPILDFGCGYGFDCDYLKHKGYDIDGYDKYFRPHGLGKRGNRYDTIICNYVLNCISKKAQLSVLKEIYNLMDSHSLAYITIRKDVKNPVVLDAPICHQTGWYRMYALTRRELKRII